VFLHRVPQNTALPLDRVNASPQVAHRRPTRASRRASASIASPCRWQHRRPQ
jgi:hypothetical protein